MLNIALVGLPSSGKSSIINSLIGKRVAQSGICRTTLSATLYENLESDDNVRYNIYDLPGIADIEDKDKKFDAMIFDTICKCNLVFWVSDISKSFITNHEYQEFNKIEQHISELGIKQGIPIQLAILLSKVDDNLENLKLNDEEDEQFEICLEDDHTPEIESIDEIKTDEETTIKDIYQKVKNKFTNIPIICYNAHGRSYYHKNSSPNLRKFIKQYKPFNINTKFNLKQYLDHIPEFNDLIKIKYFIEIKIKGLLAQTIEKLMRKPIVKSIEKFDVCDTNNIDENIRLWCPTSSKWAVDCPFEQCATCSKDKYCIRCKAHSTLLASSDFYTPGSCLSSDTRTVINGIGVITCLSGLCCISFRGTWDKILCKHGYNIKKCKSKDTQSTQSTPSKDAHNSLLSLQKELVKIFNSIYSNEIKRKIIKFILYDTMSSTPLHKDDLLGLKSEQYDSQVWNSICMNENKIDIKKYYNYLKDEDTLTANQIFRLIQIGKDLTLEDKLYLYTHPKCDTIKIYDKVFTKENIYNLEYLISGKVFEINTQQDSKEDSQQIKNTKYKFEIYTTTLLEKIKAIRKAAYGYIEEDINITMIPIAYDKFGLFWRP